MKTFTSAKDAKDFLVSRIVSEAELEGVPFNETERKELYFSESGWTLPDMDRVNDEFERSYDQDDYERKIASLIRNARERDGHTNPEDKKLWTEAIGILRKEDHYILVMIKQAGISTRPRGDFAWLLVTGLGMVGFLIGLIVVLEYLNVDMSNGAFRFYTWVAMAGAIAVYLLASAVLGRARTDDFLGKIVGRVFIRFVRPK
jgi:hypothetical protein